MWCAPPGRQLSGTWLVRNHLHFRQIVWCAWNDTPWEEASWPMLPTDCRCGLRLQAGKMSVAELLLAACRTPFSAIDVVVWPQPSIAAVWHAVHDKSSTKTPAWCNPAGAYFQDSTVQMDRRNTGYHNQSADQRLEPSGHGSTAQTAHRLQECAHAVLNSHGCDAVCPCPFANT